jgi:regulator of cell morphogenesis and NO signaling
MENIATLSLSSIALSNHQVIPVLEKYHLDFCCRGKKSLSDACAESYINVNEVLADMETVTTVNKPVMPFTDMTAEHLISYILIHHHFYVNNSIPVIENHLDKLLSKHGEKYPWLAKVHGLFTAVKLELLPHMQKEEHILFPRIKEVCGWNGKAHPVPFKLSYIQGPIAMMEQEHDNAGQMLFEIGRITNNYTPPEDACTTHRVCLQELKAFEEDLHKHVHLENNILFPMAISLLSPVARN